MTHKLAGLSLNIGVNEILRIRKFLYILKTEEYNNNNGHLINDEKIYVANLMTMVTSIVPYHLIILETLYNFSSVA